MLFLSGVPHTHPKGSFRCFEVAFPQQWERIESNALHTGSNCRRVMLVGGRTFLINRSAAMCVVSFLPSLYALLTNCRRDLPDRA